MNVASENGHNYYYAKRSFNHKNLITMRNHSRLLNAYFPLASRRLKHLSAKAKMTAWGLDIVVSRTEVA